MADIYSEVSSTFLVTFKRTEHKAKLKEYKIIFPVTVTLVYQSADTPLREEKPPKPSGGKKGRKSKD